MDEFKQNITTNIHSITDNIFSFFSGKIEELEGKIHELESSIEKHKLEISQLQNTNQNLESQYNELKTDFEDYKSVSIVKSLHKQISEKDNEIKILNKKLELTHNSISDKINKFENQATNDSTSNQEEEVDAEEEVEVDDQEEEEVQENEEEVEEVQENEEEVEEGETEEEEVEFIIKKLRGKEWYVTDDDDREIYEKLDNDEVGEKVGQYKNNRPSFFKKK